MCFDDSTAAASESMNDLVPIALFIGCLLATFGLVRVCEWLRPASPAQRADVSGGPGAVSSATRHEEAAR
jgi:hypothetical protein